MPSGHRDAANRNTYQRPLEAAAIGLEFLQSLIFVGSSSDDGRGFGRTNVFENGLDLIRGGEVLSDVELELIGAPGVRLSRVVAGLIFGGRGGRVGGDLLEECCYPLGGRRPGLVEKGDDVEGGFALNRSGQKGSLRAASCANWN